MNSPSPSDHSDGLLRFRRDLVCQRLTMGTQAYWVLKDPLFRSLQYVKEDEYAILQLVDGQRSMQQIVNACTGLFRSKFVSPESLLRFLADAKRRRLITSSGTGIRVTTASPGGAKDMGARTWQRNLLAIRLPGMRPDSVLDIVFPILRPLFTKTFCIAYVLLLMIAALIVAINWNEIAGNISNAFANRGTRTLVQLFVTLGLVKIAHEFAHAVACKSLGGDCRELGIMLLMGAPCLYCDVSDAWLMPERWKRILVSSAGIVAELGIAAIATILWLWTGDTELRQWWLIVMVVCSISTIAVNGNPLMQYDGYFIFSDLIGIPNLASQAKAALYRTTRRWLWGEMLIGDDRDANRHQSFLALYALLSGLYRMMVLSVFAIAVFEFTSALSFAIVGVLLAGFLAKGVISPVAKATLKPPRFFSQSPRRSMRMVLPIGLALAFLSMFLVPLPRTLVVPMTIRPEGSQEIFLNVGGRLIESIAERSQVQKGDIVAALDNVVLKADLLDAQLRYKQLDTQGLNLLAQRSSDSEVTAQMVAIDAAKQSMAERIDLLRAEVSKLSLVTPTDGAIFFPSDRVIGAGDETNLESWKQTPLNTENKGAWIEAGTMACIVGHASKRESILMVDQKSASLIKKGQTVELLRPCEHSNELRGSVVEVGSTPVVVCPVELTSTGLIPMDASVASSNRNTPQRTLYQVRVALDAQSEPLPIRTVGFARIRLEPASLWSRISRNFFQSFRF